MKRRKTRAAAFFLLLLFPLSLAAQGPICGEPTNGSILNFSLSIYDAAAARTIPARVFFQAPSPSTPPAPEKFTLGSLFRDFLKDAGEIWSYPLHVKTGDILPIAGLMVLTGVLINNDRTIQRSFLDYRNSHAWVGSVSPVITQMGAAGAWATAGVFLCVGLIAKEDKAVETAALATSAMLQSGILVTFLKALFGRQRPSWDHGIDRWSGPVGFSTWFETGNYGKYDSFPGGHSIAAFSLATVVAMQYQESVWVPTLAYATATGVALSRLTEGKHWLSDCLVGGVLGAVIGRMVVLNHRRRYRIVPAAGLDHGSLSLALTVSSR